MSEGTQRVDGYMAEYSSRCLSQETVCNVSRELNR